MPSNCDLETSERLFSFLSITHERMCNISLDETRRGGSFKKAPTMVENRNGSNGKERRKQRG